VVGLSLAACSRYRAARAFSSSASRSIRFAWSHRYCARQAWMWFMHACFATHPLEPHWQHGVTRRSYPSLSQPNPIVMSRFQSGRSKPRIAPTKTVVSRASSCLPSSWSITPKHLAAFPLAPHATECRVRNGNSSADEKAVDQAHVILDDDLTQERKSSLMHSSI